MANATSNVEIDFDFSQLDETSINEQQKQNLIDYINQIQTQKRALHDELNSFKTSTEQRFHQLAQEYDQVHEQLVKQREIENQMRQDNDELKNASKKLDEKLGTLQQSEQQIQTKLQTSLDHVRQLTSERDQLKAYVDEKEKDNYELKKQRDLLEEENNRVHQTNVNTISRLQELENTSVKLQSLEALWEKERHLYTEQIQQIEQALFETKKVSIDQQTQIMQLKVQLESAESQLQAQNRSIEINVDEKNERILTLDRQLREKLQQIEQLQIELQRNIRHSENQQMNNNKTIQSLKDEIEQLTKNNSVLNEKTEEQNHLLIKTSSERDVLKNEMKAITELFEKQTIEHEQTIRRLQDELDNTTQLLESIRSKGADLTQLSNFLDGTLSHIRSSDVSTTNSPSLTTNCSECRQLKSALVLEMTGKERFRFGYEQLSAMVKEAAPILRRQKQDYEASFEVIGKLTSELNEARKELTELQHLSGESIENYRFIQRENQILLDDNQSLARKIQVLLAEIEELRTGKRPAEPDFSTDSDPNQQVPLTFRNVVELQNVNQKLDKMLRELRGQNNDADDDLNRNRFDELKKDQQEQQEKLRQAKSQIESLETQLNSLSQERDFLRLLVSRSSSSQSTSSPINSAVDVHQIENLREQLQRLQEKYDQLTAKHEENLRERDDQLKASNEKNRSIQFDLLTTRTELEQNKNKLKLIEEEEATSRLTISSLRTEINGWKERHSMLLQVRNKQEQEFFKILQEIRQLKDEKSSFESRLKIVESEKKFDAIKYEQIEKECLFLKSEIVKNEQMQPVIGKLQNLAESTKEKTKLLYEAKINDLTLENDQFRQRFEQLEREKELHERTIQSQIDEIQQNLQQEKSNHLETKNKFLAEKNKAEEIQKKLNELENKIQSINQKTDFEQQMGDYEKELKILRVKLEAVNRELELKQSMIQSGIDNVSQLTNNERQAVENLTKLQQEFGEKSILFENQIKNLEKDLETRQATIDENLQTIRSLNENISANDEKHRTEFNELNERYQQLVMEKSQFDETLRQLEQIKEINLQLELTIEQQKSSIEQNEILQSELNNQIFNLQSEQQRLSTELDILRCSIAEKDHLIENQVQAAQRAEQTYRELEEKHKAQHETMLKLTTHLAARESEVLGSTTDESSVNESWNTILTTNNYLREENIRLAKDYESVRLDNAQIKERNSTLEENVRVDQNSISELKLKISQLQQLQDRFDRDQQKISSLEDRCRNVTKEKDEISQEIQRIKISSNSLQSEKENLLEKLKAADKTRTEKETELQETSGKIAQLNDEMETNKSKVAALESENTSLKQLNRNLRQIAIKYKTLATGNPAAATPGGVTPIEGVELAPVGASSQATAPVPDGEPRRSQQVPADVIDGMNKLREALSQARSTMASQQSKLTQLNNELVQALKNRIPADQTEYQSIIDTIRQNYENEANDFKRIIQIFETADLNEQSKEISRLRKKIEELLANKSTTTSSGSTSTISKSSEDVTPKRVPPFSTTQNPEPVISRVAPMAPASGRQIGVATPMTASSTSSAGATAFAAGSVNEPPSSQSAASVEHSIAGTLPTTTVTTGPSASASTLTSSTPQLVTAAGINLLQKRPRPDETDQKSNESTLKRNKPETETAPLIAHVEPQVREQQQTNNQTQAQSIEPNTSSQSSGDNLMTTDSNDPVVSLMRESPSVGQGESDVRPTASSTVTNTQAAMTTMNAPNEATAIVEPVSVVPTETTSVDQRRHDIAPIVYNIRNIAPIFGGNPIPPARPSNRRPFVGPPRRAWMPRGAGGGRGTFGGRGAGGLGGNGP